MNTVLSKILETGTVTSPDGQVFKLHSHIPQTDCEIIQAWIETHNPQRLLEIGLGYGISALFICDALQAIGNNTTYHIIDSFQSSVYKATGLFNLNNADFEDVYTFHEERSEICLPELLKQGFRFDFALIDGNHTFDHTLIDFFYVNRMLEVGGIVIFDDIQMPSIQKVVAHVATYDCYTLLQMPKPFLKSKQAIVRKMCNIPQFRIVGFKKIATDKRDWDWHAEF